MSASDAGKNTGADAVTNAGAHAEGNTATNHMSYAFLGPELTFTEAALLTVPGAQEATRVPMTSVPAALAAVRAGDVDAAMVPIENSVEGGVSATLDAIAVGSQLRIVREVLVPVTFDLVARPGTAMEDIRTVATHSHAIAQCRRWVDEHLPDAEYVAASSTAAAAMGLLEEDNDDAGWDAAICGPVVAQRHPLEVLARNIGDREGAVTRFVLVARPGSLPPRTGADKTTLVVPLPEDHPGALMGILEQFATRGVNLSRIESRPTGMHLGDYLFSIDAQGHIEDARVADAIAGLHRISPHTRFLGSYPRADQLRPDVARHHSDDAFIDAHRWVDSLISGSVDEPNSAPDANGSRPD